MPKIPTVRLLGVISLLALTVVEVPAQQHFESTGKGTVIIEMPGPFVGTPLLDGFRVRFGPSLNQPSTADHHLRTLAVRPQRPEPTNITVTYADKNADDRFAFDVSFHSREIAGLEIGETEDELVCAIQCSRPLTRPSPDHVFVLRGFKISAHSTPDQHVERLAVFEASGSLIVALERAAWFGTNVFTFQVDFAFLPPTAVQNVGELWGTSGHPQETIPAGESVIRGFDFRFTNGDHHVREIGVQTPDDGSVKVFFNDRNSDDPFVWSVRWAVLAPGGPPILR